jgi:serine/threonine protein kinase
MAPEIVGGQGYGYSVDWWAFGVLLYELFFHHPPFRGASVVETYENILKATPNFPPQAIDPVAENLIRQLLCKTRRYRLVGQAVLRHEFFASVSTTSAAYRTK